MRTEAEIRDALHTVIKFFEQGNRLCQENKIQAIGFMTAMHWVLGSEKELPEVAPKWPGNNPEYTNPIDAMVRLMKDRIEPTNQGDA
jgi:hypothetical protein